MAQIFKYKGDLDAAALKEIEKKKILGLDSEAEGLKIPHFHKMSLIQIFDGDKVYISGKGGIFSPGMFVGEVKIQDNLIKVILFSNLKQITFVNVDLESKKK